MTEERRARPAASALKASLSDWLAEQDASLLPPGALDWSSSGPPADLGPRPSPLQPTLPGLNTSLSASFTGTLPPPFPVDMLKASSLGGGMPQLNLSGIGLPASMTAPGPLAVSSSATSAMPRLAAPPPPTVTAPSGATLRLVSQPEGGAMLVKRQAAEYVLEFSGGAAREKGAAGVKGTAEVLFWIDNVQRWEVRDDAAECTVAKKAEGTGDGALVRLTWQVRFQKTSKMLPVYVRFTVSAGAQAAGLTLDSNKVVLIGREDLQKTRAEGVVFWMRVAGGIENELFKGKYPWAAVEALLKEHFARRMGGEGRMFDARELAYIQERAKLPPSTPVLVGREAFLQVFWPWLFPVIENIVRYKDLWNQGLLHGFFQTAEAEQLIRDCPPGTFLLRFCSNSAFEPQGALAVSVATKSGVQHILLTAEALEKDPLPRLLARYTDCVCFYPSTPKVALDAIRREMDDVPSVAHYRDVGFATCSPAAPAPGHAALPLPALPTAAPRRDGAAPKRRLADLEDVAVPGQVIVRTEGSDKEARFHLSEGLTFGALLGTALKHLRLDVSAHAWTFSDKDGVAYPDDAAVASAFRGLRNPPTLFLSKLK